MTDTVPDDKDVKIKKLENEVRYLRRIKSRYERIINSLTLKESHGRD